MPAPRLKRIPSRYKAVLRSVMLSVCMSAVVSFIVTARNVGLCMDMPGVWLAAWQVSCAIAVPARFVVTPLVNRFVGVLVEPSAARQAG